MSVTLRVSNATHIVYVGLSIHTRYRAMQCSKPLATIMRLQYLLIAAVLLVVIACAAKETLIAKSAAVPAGLDLSGQWLLGDTSGTTQRAAREMLVYAFLETGQSVKVTQTESGLFISFDRSVVEEYRFGEHRQVSVGEISADRVSGWEGRAYIIETLDKDGAKLIETYRIAGDGNRLTRSIVIWLSDRRYLSLEQVFDRV